MVPGSSRFLLAAYQSKVEQQSILANAYTGLCRVLTHISVSERGEFVETVSLAAFEENLRLVVAKSTVGLLNAGVDHREPTAQALEFGTWYRESGWGPASRSSVAWPT